MGNKKRTIRKRVKHRLKRLGAWAIAVSYQIHLWCVWRTARIEVVGCDRLFETLRRHDRVALAIWHENLIMSIYGLRECKPTTLASKSDIGDVIATVLKRNNFHVFRGGSSRGKSRRSPALEKMVEYFKSHRDILIPITVDGSAGPARKMKPGVIALAEQAQAPIFVMHCECRPCFRIWTWDKTRIPLGFGKIVMVFEGPILPQPPGLKGFRKSRDQTDLLLRDTCKRAETLLKTGELPPADPALELDPSYGEGETRRGRSLFAKGESPIVPRPVEAPAALDSAQGEDLRQAPATPAG